MTPNDGVLASMTISSRRWMFPLLNPGRSQETTMFIFESDNKKMRADTDACYEAVASQEEAYLEKTEEDLRMILEADDPHPDPGAGPNQQRESAVEELITGDSDDPPLSEESVAKMLRPPL